MRTPCPSLLDPSVILHQSAYTPRVNEKFDIYSFGVVLLELVTGKEPMFAGEHASLVEWAHHQHSERTTIDEILDAEIKKPEFLEDLETMFMLRLACTNRNPLNRLCKFSTVANLFMH